MDRITTGHSMSRRNLCDTMRHRKLYHRQYCSFNATSQICLRERPKAELQAMKYWVAVIVLYLYIYFTHVSFFSAPLFFLLYLPARSLAASAADGPAALPVQCPNPGWGPWASSPWRLSPGRAALSAGAAVWPQAGAHVRHNQHQPLLHLLPGCTCHPGIKGTLFWWVFGVSPSYLYLCCCKISVSLCLCQVRKVSSHPDNLPSKTLF